MSNPPDFGRLRALFERACELPRARQQEFVAEACAGEPALRDALQKLLASDRDPLPAFDELEVEPGLPERIGRFRILSVLGEGGMGVVYRAQQEQPRREVALKVVRSSLLGEEQRRRFLLEAQVLGWLNHPGIAQIYEAGTADGAVGSQPYFAMELIAGEPIHRFVESRALGLRDRLALLASVADAVHHAHQKGVVHRDLKPANVLVTEEGSPKVVDFGVARVTVPDGDLPTTHTLAGQLVGTLTHMSPEQVAGDPSAIDARADVYALGVLAYEILTGSAPFDLAGKTVPQATRTILEETATRIGALDTRCSGDVETIVGKALEKEPAQRYASAGEFAADLRRYLADQPIAARPPSTWYQIRKFSRRHRALVGAVACAATVLVLATLWSAVMYTRAEANVAEYRRMADVKLLGELRDAAAGDLWPAWPAKLGELQAWLVEAEALVGRLPRHRERLAEIRARAFPYDDATREDDRAREPVARGLRYLQLKRAEVERRLQNSESEEERTQLAAALAQTEDNIEEVAAQLDQRVTWEFEDPADAWEHTVVAALVEDLEAFAAGDGALASVRDRIASAREIEERSVAAFAAEWDAAIRAVGEAGESNPYGKLVLRPQTGLVPLGADPASGLQEFAVLDTGEIPVRDDAGALQLGPDFAVVLVLVPGGSFRMGADNLADPWSAEVERPVHEVEVGPFFIGKFEVTQGQWLRMAGDNPSQMRPGGAKQGVEKFTLRNPVESVSWTSCNEVLGRLGLSLPTEAQWEFAARAHSETRWWFGDDPSEVEGCANVADERWASRREEKAAVPGLDDGHIYHAAVGSYRANALGLHDVVGNVAEWCRDYYGYYYLPVEGPEAERLAHGRFRAMRGGAFSYGPLWGRSSHRNSLNEGTATPDVGLRAGRRLFP